MRKLATAAAVSLALTYGNAQALGLGDIEMRSALNQPMNAEIRLTSVKPGEAEGMIVQLASPDAFARAGIERTSALTDLRFSVDRSSGSPVIRITSSRPVVEPFLNFLLEVDWPQGRMVREYTVLLDPPVFMTPSASQQSSAEAPATTNPDTVSLLAPTPIERTTPAPAGLDGLTVDVAGGTTEVGNEVSGSAEGEAVALDDLFNDAGAAPVTTDSGDVVVLSDLDAPNPAATQQFLEEQALAADVEIPDVELLGGTAEVSDTFVSGQDTTAPAAPVAAADIAGSEIVSLDDLEVTPATQQTGAAAAQAPASAATPSGQAAERPGEITVQRGDTLYSIAQRNAVEGVTLQQMMLALLNANQGAFIDGNINLVKAGATLRIPGQGEAAQLTQTQALAEIGKQHQLWQEYRDNLRGTTGSQVATATVPTPSGSVSDAASTVDSVAANAEPWQSTSASGGAASVAENAADAGATLSDEARQILESARAEIRQRDELKIVAEQDATTTTASATAPDEEGSPEGQLAELNRKLQLAREELASSRLESGDLDEQVSELQSTSDNLDTLVAMRQNDLARLQAQLEEARSAADAASDSAADALADGTDAVADAGDAAADVAGDAADAASGAIGDAVDATTDTVSDAADAAGDAIGDAADATAEATGNVVDAAGEAAADAVAAVQDGVADAGDTVADAVDAAAPVTPAAPQAWYEGILQDKTRLGIVGVGALGLAGVLGTLLFRRRRSDDDELLDFNEEVEFIDAEEAADLQGDLTGDATQAQPKAAAAAAAAMAANADVSDEAHDEQDATLALDADDDDGIDKDDTLSEVDVYLAYGLHGQAEDLLNKALEKSPNHPEYTVKLLETHHAQGNTESFHQLAETYHAHHGEDNDGWTRISELGQDLQPGNTLYAAAAEDVQSVGIGDHSGPKLSDEDFAAEPVEDVVGSVNSDFSNSADSTDMVDEETALLDESLDPAFAFDESDLEATGDFSQLSEELKAEDDGSIDFPGFGETASDESVSQLAEAEQPGDALEDLSGAVELDDKALDGSIDFEEFDLDGAASLDGGSADAGSDSDTGEVAAMSDDLTLDLEQLSGDLELDSTELLDSSLGNDLSELEIPDLTGDNDLLSAGDGDIDNADEMDTMMDLAKAYIDMGDKDSASSALDEIVRSGTPAQVSEAETLLRKIS